MIGFLQTLNWRPWSISLLILFDTYVFKCVRWRILLWSIPWFFQEYHIQPSQMVLCIHLFYLLYFVKLEENTNIMISDFLADKMKYQQTHVYPLEWCISDTRSRRYHVMPMRKRGWKDTVGFWTRTKWFTCISRRTENCKPFMEAPRNQYWVPYYKELRERSVLKETHSDSVWGLGGVKHVTSVQPAWPSFQLKSALYYPSLTVTSLFFLRGHLKVSLICHTGTT